MGSNAHAKEQSDGYRWFFGMGLVAVLFALFLATVDQKLSDSDRERRLGATLKELRTAQSSLPSRVTDSRQTQSYLHAPGSHAEAAHDEHASNDHAH